MSRDGTPVLQFEWLTTSAMVTPEMRNALTACWRDVSNAGGAVGFPFPPVDASAVTQATDALVRSLDAPTHRLLVATSNGALAGWLVLVGNDTRLCAHWASVQRVQSALDYRGQGVGRALMGEVARAARDDLGLEQLHLGARGGSGLERFYESCGWREVGRWPASLRLGPHDDRDDVLMVLNLLL